MKKKTLVHSHESAKIYSKYYKPSLNIPRFLKSVLAVVLTGSAPTADVYKRRR
jgi:hypothetical protein